MTVPGPCAFEASTPADAQTKPCRVSAITSGGRERTTSAASPQDHLELPGIALLAGELDRARGRLDLVEADDPALDLRDRLLGDDDDVAGLEPAAARAAVGEEPREVVPLLELRQARESGSTRISPAHGQWTPVTRRPACAL